MRDHMSRGARVRGFSRVHTLEARDHALWHVLTHYFQASHALFRGYF